MSQTPFHSDSVYLGVVRPFAHVLSNTVNSQESRRTPIYSVLFHRDPPNIARLVVSVVIDAVKFMNGAWFITDLTKKFSVGREPEFNAAPAVTSIGLLFWVLTPTFCRKVRVVFRATPAGNTRLATARSSMAAYQMSACGDDELSAATFTQPSRFCGFRAAIKTDNKQLIKRLSDYVSEVGSGWCKRLVRDVKLQSFHGFIGNIIAHNNVA